MAEPGVLASGDNRDVERGEPRSEKPNHGLVSFQPAAEGEVYKPEADNPKWYQWLIEAGVEENGIRPVPVEGRTSTSYDNLFTIFFSSLLCVLPIPTGMLATYAYGMSLRDSSLTILFFSLLCAAPPAFLGCGGPKTGLRQMIQARYSFGRWIVTIPLLLNAATVTGFCLISAIISGQTIAAISPGDVSVSIGIVISLLVSFAVSIVGYKVLHYWERWQWVVSLIVITIMVGCGGKFLSQQAETEPATAPQVLSYGGIIAGYFITYSGTASDYGAYHNPSVSKLKVFTYIYMGMLLPTVPLLVLGAAMGGAVTEVDGWADAYDAFGSGGIMAAMLASVNGFGKFVLVFLALSPIGNIAMSMYSVALNLQMLVPFFTRVPRFVFIIVVNAIMIPIAIKAAQDWEASLENFLALIGYWAGCFCAVMIEELVVFRRMDFLSFDHAIWNVGKKLPTGIPAIAASILSFALIIPGMDEVWYVGPIAETTGDIGFEMAFFVTALLYLPFRWIEIKWRGHL